MRPRPFDYYAPSSLKEALSLLSTSEDAKILAGGQSLITLMKLRLAAPSALIDINRISALDYVREENGMVSIGALTRHDKLASNHLIQEKLPLLAEAANLIADQQVRNRGSIGGSLAHADPSADLPTACVALNAELKVTSENGSRLIQAQAFFLDFFSTALGGHEIIEEVRIPIPPTRSGGAYSKLTRGHNDFALVALAAQASLTTAGICERITVVLGGVAPKPTRATQTEETLAGRKADEHILREAASKAANGLTPTPDPRASPGFKKDLVCRLADKTLRVAFKRAVGGC